MIAESAFSQEALRRLRRPRCRGQFEAIDAARRQLGLLSVADGNGQLRIYWLIDLETTIVEDARFLAFGDLSSHAVGDAFTELVRGRDLDAALSLPAGAVEALLRDNAAVPAFGTEDAAPYDCLADIRERARAAWPEVMLLPKPVEVVRYERKRQQDWDEHDRAWLPLSLLRKLAKVQQVLGEVLTRRLNRPDLQYDIEGLHDDFRLRVRLPGVRAEEVPTILQFFQSELRNDLHPEIVVEEAGDA